MAILVSLLAFAFTLLGGLSALRITRRLALVLGFSAGAVVGVALFDLAPEALEIGTSRWGAANILAVSAMGYALYHLLHHGLAPLAQGRALAPLTLTIHSLLDGLSIGLSFQVSAAAGAIVAIGVVVHDLCDGINTVTVVRRSGGSDRAARRWLAADACAPVLGAAGGSAVTLSDGTLGVALALFAGFFLYIGASDLLPASARPEAGFAPAAMAALGMAAIYAAVRLASL